MANPITDITFTPDPPVSTQSTEMTAVVTDPSTFVNAKFIISSPIYADNQLNGGIWGGGEGYLKINCNTFDVVNELIGIPTDLVIATPLVGAYLLVNQQYEFSGTATDATNYDWDYGDDTNVIIGQSTQHTYTIQGDKIVRFTAMNDNGYAYITQTIHVGDLPVIDITSPISTSKYKNLEDISFTIDVENYISIKWNFGDGTILENASDNITHAYDTPGTYTAICEVTNNYGTVTESVTFRVYQRPTNMIISSPIPTGLYYARIPISFVGSAIGATAYKWDFGDGGTYMGASTQHTYASTGTYTATFTAYTDNVNDTIDVTIVVLSQ